MKAYPDAATQPNRKMRKSQRKKIFEENQNATKVAREARRERRIGEKSA